MKGDVIQHSRAAPAKPSTPRRDPPQGLERVVERYEDVKEDRDYWRTMALRVAIALVVAVILEPFAYAAGVWLTEKGFVIGLDHEGHAVRIPEISDPEYDDVAIRRFCSEAIGHVGTYAYHDFDMRFRESQNYFTEPMWRAYNDQMVERHISESVHKFRQAVTTQVRGSCDILDHGIKDGRYWWKVRAYADRTISAGDVPGTPQPLTINIDIVRTQWTKANELVAIDGWEE